MLGRRLNLLLFVCDVSVPLKWQESRVDKCILKSGAKAQSAMEYLMTYGWAILIIAVVLASLFSLGVFNSGTGVASTACSTRVGYLCSNPVLLSNGLLSTTIGSSRPINVTGIACSSGSSAPSSFSPANITLAAGAQQNVDFPCALPSDALGTPFSGTLWLRYNQSGQSNLVAQIASVSAKVTGFGNGGGGGGGTTTIPSSSTYAFSATAGSGGSVSCSSAGSTIPCTGNYNSGNTITLTATPDADYSFRNWTGTLSHSSTPWTLTLPTRAVTETASFLSYSYSTSIWRPTNSLYSEEEGISCVTSGSYIYCMGGTDPAGDVTATVQSAQILGNGIVSSWQPINSLATEEYQFSCVTSGSYIYCMGGIHSNQGAGDISYESTVQYAHILGNGLVSAWQTTTNTLVVGEAFPSCVVSGGYIDCMGGASHVYGQNQDSTVQYAQILGNGLVSAWQTTNSLYEAEAGHSCITSGSYLYCMGGEYPWDLVQSSQILGNGLVSAWQTTNSLAATADGLGCVTVNGYIYCMGGGMSQENVVQTTQILGNGIVSVWQTTNTLYEGEAPTSCIVSGGYIYCMGSYPDESIVQSAQIR